MKRTRSSCGRTLIETVIGAALLVVVIGAATVLAMASSGVQQSTNDATTAAMRADRALQFVASALRKGSLATLRQSDGTAFASGTSSSGFQIQAVTNYNGAAVLDTAATYHFDIVGGAASGSLIQTQNGVDRVLVTGVTSFTVTRANSLFTIDIRTRSGSFTDDRARTVHATLQVASRNS